MKLPIALLLGAVSLGSTAAEPADSGNDRFYKDVYLYRRNQPADDIGKRPE